MPSLPFDQEAQITDQSGTNFGEVGSGDDDPALFGCHLQQLAGAAVSRTGVVWDWEGQVEIAAAEFLLTSENRRLIVDGETYQVQSAVANRVLPHVAVHLKRA